MTHHNFALHLGVARYRSFAPDGSGDLPGAVDDAHRWGSGSRRPGARA